MSEHSFNDNPVSLELRTLRASVARFQEEAHASAVKLQRHSLDSAKLHERAVHLERENDLLKAELAILRANPHPTDGVNDSDARSQVQDLTLALRRLSHKLSSTEDALLSKTTELINVQVEAIKAKAAADGAYELGARVRGREEAGLAREHHLQDKIVQLEEDARIMDIALKEYAALVREMETTKSTHVNGSARNSEDVDEGTRISATLLEGQLTRSRLLAQFEVQTAQLEGELHGARTELEVTTSLLEAEKKGTAALVQELGNTKLALEKLHLEDGTAAKMVSRYMQFSQTATNALLSKLSTMNARHAGTLSTLSSQNHSLITRLRASEAQGERLLSALDELGGEIMRETWGRRREVGLRIRMGGREERIVEGLRRWVRKGDEMMDRTRGDKPSDPTEAGAVLDVFFSMAQDARILLASLDEGVLDEELGLSLSGSKARALLVDIGLEGLLDELRQETEKRIMLEKRLAAVKDEAVLNGAISNDEAEKGDIEFKSHSADPVIARESNSAVPEKAPIFAPTPGSPQLSQLFHQETFPNKNSLTVYEATEEVSNATTPISTTEDDVLSITREVQPSLFPSAKNPSISTNVETKGLQAPSLDLSPKTDDSAPNIPDLAENQLTIPNGAIGVDLKDDDPSGPSTAQEISRTASTIVEIPKDSGSDIPSTVIAADQSIISSEPVISTSKVALRYDDLQRAFRDCHIALELLKASLMGTSSEPLQPTIIPADVLDAALRRLDDYTEDARVELEIRISDEALLAKGYEALLSVPGALSTVSLSSPEANGHDDNEVPILSDIERQVAEFVNGTDLAVHRARETFTRKLEDVQHDIAALKRAIHDPESLAAPGPLPLNSSGNLTPSSSTSTLVAPSLSIADLSNTGAETNQSSGGWTSWIRSASGPSGPAPPLHGPAPTFGNIMTSPRLRHTPSSGNVAAAPKPQSALSRRPSFFGLGGGASEPPPSPLAALELRVPMPNFAAPGAVGSQPLSAGSSSVFGGAYALSPTSPLKSMGMAPATRVRTVSSTMYMLGLGAAGAASGNGVSGRAPRSASATGAFAVPPSPLNSSRQGPVQGSSSLGQRVPISSRTKDVEEEEERTEDDNDTDVE
ncbi:hypothetical protein BJ912DRAFT_908972 [Pholiota molesta]|nr:hypothetical protein BJ912DRAFT_908972 [Pholiota molesta]